MGQVGVSLVACLVTFCVIAISDAVDLADYDSRASPSHSFRTPFYLVRGTIPFWQMTGSVVITDDYVRLTPAEKSRVGSIWNTKPLEFENWEVELRFKVHGGGNLGGDGFAFWYTEQPLAEGPAFGSSSTWKGLLIAMDTFDNDGSGNHPYIHVSLNDGTVPYEKGNDNKNNELGGCKAYYRGQESKITITHAAGFLQIMLIGANGLPSQPCVRVNLKEPLPAGYHFGLSAETGGLYDNHDIFGFSTSRLMPKGAQDLPPLPNLSHQREQQLQHMQMLREQRQMEQQQLRQQMHQRVQETQPPTADVVGGSQNVRSEAAEAPAPAADAVPHEHAPGTVGEPASEAQQPLTEEVARDAPAAAAEQPEQAVLEEPQVAAVEPVAEVPVGEGADAVETTPPVGVSEGAATTETKDPAACASDGGTGAAAEACTDKPAAASAGAALSAADLAAFRSLSQKVSALQTAQSGLVGSVAALRTSLDAVSEAQKSARATLQQIMTKQEAVLSSLETKISNTAAHQDTNLQREVAGIRSIVSEVKELFNTKLQHHTDSITRKFDEFSRQVQSIRGDVESTKQSQRDLHANIQNVGAAAESSSSSLGFWAVVLCLQVTFGIAFMWWRKYMTEKHQKLF